MDEQQDIARRLHELRLWRGKPLKVIADRAGISESYLSRLEHGDRRLDKRTLIVALAAALEVSPSELIGQPVRWQDPAMAEAQATIPARRLALVGTELEHADIGTSRPVNYLVAQVDRCVALRTARDFAAMGTMLPQLLTDLYASASATRDDDRTMVTRQLIRALVSAMTLPHAFGYSDLAFMITERGIQAADDLHDPAWSAVAAISCVHALLPVGGHSQANALASRATDAARAATGDVNGDAALAAYGAVCLLSAWMASLTGRADEAATRFTEAETVADRVGECGPDVAFFGPTNVALYRVATALEHGDLDQAVELVAPADPTHITSTERRAKYWLDTGRALAGVRGRDEAAVAAFRRSEQLAALRLRSNVYAREAVTELLPRLRRDSTAGRELRGIAARMGIAA